MNFPTDFEPLDILNTEPMTQPDFEKLNTKFPNRNWREVWRRHQQGEFVHTTMIEAMYRYPSQDHAS